jgi:hypothetical protein
MSIAPGSVHDETAFVRSNSFGKSIRTFFVDYRLPALGAGLVNIDCFATFIQ